MYIKPVSEHQSRSIFVRGFLTSAVVAALLTPVSPVGLAGTTAEAQNRPLTTQALRQNTPLEDSELIRTPKIQVAIVLDTSNSMDGLIDQTRNQLWQVVNEFSSARQNGLAPILEIALFEYGNDGISRSAGYVRKLNDFTRELDAVSAGLFSLTTNGGSEYCGFAIDTVVNSLQWSQSSTDIKTIFIAGNESFAQGPINYREAVKLARRHGISINTIHAGSHETGISDQWQTGAMIAGGDYLSIDANQQVVHIVAPQDEKIVELNARLNQTYVPYGEAGAESAQRQMEQDALSSDISTGLLAKRAASKSSAFYSNSRWDLVDALDDGEISAQEVVQIEDEALPEPMLGMSSQEKMQYLEQKAEQRRNIKQEISELSRLRAAYVTEQKRAQAAAAPSMSDALTGAIRNQAQQKNFLFEN